MEIVAANHQHFTVPTLGEDQDKKCVSTFALVAEQLSTMLLRQPASHSHPRIKLITTQPRSTTALGEAERRLCSLRSDIESADVTSRTDCASMGDRESRPKTGLVGQ